MTAYKPFVVDYLYAQTPEKLKLMASHGVVGVMRYLCPEDFAKIVTVKEVQEISAAGMKVGLVFEWGARDVLGGAKEGTRDATMAYAEAKKLGIPRGRPIFYVIDFRDQDIATTRKYFQAAQAVHPDNPAGVYGPPEAIDAFASEYDWLWVAGAWPGKINPKACLWQKHQSHQFGFLMDENEILKEDFGGWSI